LVSFGGEPAIVPDPLMQDLRQTLGELVDATQQMDELVRGDQIFIHTGPVAGYQAIFDRRLAGNKRVRVLLEMLRGRTISVDLKSAQIKRTRP
jgi:transcription antitermination factor NusG